MKLPDRGLTSPMTTFLPGLQLNHLYYREVVRPILDESLPSLLHSAARLGQGSEVLGYDDSMSTDHDWGPRFQLFLTEKDLLRYGDEVTAILARELPPAVRGYPTHFGPPDEEGTRLMEAQKEGPVDHRIEITSVRSFMLDYLGLDPSQELTVRQWLTVPQQLLLGVTAGQVYEDQLDALAPIRRQLSYFPRDVWLYILAAQWSRLGQEEAFVGRAGFVGDDLGSAVIGSRLVHDIMQLQFLMERAYVPYPKWFGTAFARLSGAATLTPLLQAVLAATSWQDREEPLCQALELMAQRHNALGITPRLEPKASRFHGRPFRVIGADRFVSALRDAIEEESLRGLESMVGSIDQFSHSTDLRSYPALHRRLESLYE